MPIPKPNTGESHDDFISRCMSDMEAEFPDNDQRLAVCNQSWEDNRAKDIRGAPDNLELRVGMPIELREDDDGARIEGHAAVFNKLSEPIFGMFREVIRPGAFKRAIKEKQDVRALIDHDPGRIIGRTKNGSLTLKEDKDGLFVSIKPPKTQAGKDIVENIRNGNIDGMSFGFEVKREIWNEAGALEEFSDEEKFEIREILDVNLWDVSAVTFPAYPDTSVAVRSRQTWKESKAKEIEPEPAKEPAKDEIPHRLRMAQMKEKRVTLAMSRMGIESKAKE